MGMPAHALLRSTTTGLVSVRGTQGAVSVYSSYQGDAPSGETLLDLQETIGRARRYKAEAGQFADVRMQICLRLSPGEFRQEAEAAITDNVELEKIAWPGHAIARAQDDTEEDEVEHERVEGRRLAEYSALHDGPGKMAGEAKGIPT